ncbi:MAG: hypothetical protein BGO76_05960 [Caedibacter sp. 38-128]|nr:GNAT family N-acetyltransferase [Holosporales bacterium]OJX03589.1 MAG: hypothetical protein BGO76_05960 [Caedibacter sp. 38-128]
MRSDIKIRELGKNDREAYFGLLLLALEEAPESFLMSTKEAKQQIMQTFQDSLTSDDKSNLIFGAFLHDALLGTLGLLKKNKDKASSSAIIRGVYTQPKYRGIGIAKTLLETAIHHAKEHMKCHVISLSVESASRAAQKLYESYGFKIERTEVKEPTYEISHMFLPLRD